ncbi:MAG: DUF3800 domain-containing protein [Bacteroidota bacterium]
MNNFIENAKKWRSGKRDHYGKDREIFLKYISKHCVGLSKAKSIDELLMILNRRFSKPYSRESFQHTILVPLREEKGFFIGTGNKGIYLIKNSTDALKTISFYSRRINSEEKHLKNLMMVLKKDNNREKVQYPESDKRIADVYFDESGKPTLSNKREEPYFIVCAVIIDSKNKRYNLLDEKFNFIRKQLLQKTDKYEIKHNNLNTKKHKLLLSEISTLDYGFAAVVFFKDKLDNKKFNHSKSFYKFANQYLVNKVLTRLGRVNLYFDNYSGQDEPTQFDQEFKEYIKSKNLFWPIGKINDLQVLDSKKSNKVQMVDLIGGAIRKAYIGNDFSFLSLIENKQIEIYHFPNIVE